QRTLLALLALRAGEVVTTGQIVESLWGEQDIRDPANAVQVLVSKLRRALRPDTATDRYQSIATGPAGYKLDVDPACVDAVRFAQVAADGRRLLAAGDVANAASRLHEALMLWRGAPLADIPDDLCVGD